MQKSNKEIKTIKIFEPDGNYNENSEEILDKVFEGVILIDEYNRFEGVIYKEDNAEFIKGYLGKDVISIELLERSIYAFKQKDDTFDGVLDMMDEDESEVPCKVSLGSLKESNTIDTDTLKSKIFLLKNNKVMNLERTYKK